MSVKLGIDGKLYFCAAGIGGTPAWTELTNVRNVTLTLNSAEADVTTRRNNGWKASVATLKDGAIEFEMVWDTADAGFSAIKDSYFNKTPIGLAVMDGEVASSEGLWADCMISQFTRDESLEGAMTAKVSAKPTYSENAPQWKERTA